MSTSWNIILKRFAAIAAVVAVLFGILLLFSYDVIKIDWVSFMGIQPSFKPMEDPLPVPARSIPIDGPIAIPNMGAPDNPVKSDAISLGRGRELYMINCQMCHGPLGLGNGPIGALLVTRPVNLTSPAVQALSDGAIFFTITNGIKGLMPALNENLTVRDRWDVVNFIRTFKASQ